jgi:hypothetical protein
MSALIQVGMLTGDASLFVLGIALSCDEDEESEPSSCIIRPVIPNSRIDFALISESSSLHRFRFTVHDIFVLCDQLRLPAIFHLSREWGGYCFTAQEGLALVCERLAHPCTYFSLVEPYGRGISALEAIFNYLLRFLEHRFRHLLHWDARRLQASLPIFAHAIRAKCPMANCIGFLDGTRRQHNRPGHDQAAYFNYHSWFHCLGFQGIVTPDGLLVHVSQGEEGSVHDHYLLNVSAIEDVMALPQFSQYYLYADAGYAVYPNLIVPFKKTEGQLTPGERAFNIQMASVRISVEWMFGRVTQLWRFLDHHADLMVFKSSLSTFYRVTVLLTNIRTILDDGNIASDYFELGPPSLDEYLRTSFLVV